MASQSHTTHRPKFEEQHPPNKGRLTQYCEQALTSLPTKIKNRAVVNICSQVKQRPECESTEKRPIFHFDSPGKGGGRTKVLVLAVLHGDEQEGGSIARRWMQRLIDIRARNRWRIIPILNPDGMRRKTRTNANGVDINRNFPSNDWDELALTYWREKKNSDPRRYPGPGPASEAETRCVLRHIEDFRPDLIVAVHTPYGVLDFDGPSLRFPTFKGLPWVSLGTFPGSLGRYMWRDKKTPVLTVELKGDALLAKLDEVDFLQDIAGTVSLRVNSSIIKSQTSTNRNDSLK